MNSDELKELIGKEYVTVSDAARMLELSVVTVVRKIRQGQLEAVNINPGGELANWRVRSSSLKRLLGIEDTEQIPA